jgi:PPP family 3-phenylpropionic acid transporter
MSPSFRLATLYFLYFAGIGAFMPYWGPYLAERGFSGAQIGTLMAVLLATKIVAPNLWGWLADLRGERVPAIRWAAWGSLLTFTGVLLHFGYAWLLAIIAIHSFFWNAILPLLEATTLQSLGRDTHRYAWIRLWGSLGFIVAVVGLGVVFDHLPLAALPWILLGMLLVFSLMTGTLQEPADGQTSGPAPVFLGVLRRPEVVTLFLACFFMQASHGPYYAFFTLYLEEQGISRARIGQLWALGVAAEILVFLIAPRLILHYGAWFLVTLALLLATLRWWLLAGFADHLGALLLIQVLHAASYGVYHAAAISLIYRYFPGRLQGRGQALYSSLTFGLGGAFGALLSGYLWDGLGSSSVYGLATVLAGAGVLVAGGGWLRERVLRANAPG